VTPADAPFDVYLRVRGSRPHKPIHLSVQREVRRSGLPWPRVELPTGRVPSPISLRACITSSAISPKGRQRGQLQTLQWRAQVWGLAQSWPVRGSTVPSASAGPDRRRPPKLKLPGARRPAWKHHAGQVGACHPGPYPGHFRFSDLRPCADGSRFSRRLCHLVCNRRRRPCYRGDVSWAASGPVNCRGSALEHQLFATIRPARRSSMKNIRFPIRAQNG